jgi:hypothetical protein
METSAYQSINIDKAFKIMIEEIFSKFHKQVDDVEDIHLNDKAIIDLNYDPKKKKKGCC